jgi:nucleoside 2-deoxyribosyltransferase
MTFQATVVRVLIASPGDTGQARVLLRDVLQEWNSLHSEDSRVMLLPVMWERDATPEMGDRPQGIINRQLVDASDILVGIFWTRLGTPTSEAESGTAEEIERFIRAGKPVLIYFSQEPVIPNSIDAEQYERLNAFRESLKARGLFDGYTTQEELWRKASAALTRTIRQRFRVEVAERPFEASRPAARLLARIERERELRGLTRTGRPQYTTRHTLVIENSGTAPAEDLIFTFESNVGDDEPPSTFGNDEPARRLAQGGSLAYPLAVSMGTADQFDIVMQWREGDTSRNERQTLRV